jgi:hypothetical protein
VITWGQDNRITMTGPAVRVSRQLRRRAGRVSRIGVEVVSLGCRMNLAESEAMQAMLAQEAIWWW